MPVNFSYADGSSIAWNNGYPDNYMGYKMDGAIVHSWMPPFGQIVVQELMTLYCTIRYQFIQWISPASIRCNYSDPGVHVRAVFKNHLYEGVKGSGTIDAGDGEFVALLSNSWQSVISHADQDTLVCIDTIWSPQFFQKYNIDSSISSELGKTHFNFPALFAEVNRRVTPEMRMILRNILNCPFIEPFRSNWLNEQLCDFYCLVFGAREHTGLITPDVSPVNEEAVARARQYIAADLDRPFSLRQISRHVGVGDTALKTSFRKITGYGLQEYQVYLRLLRVRDEILASDEPLKTFFKRAGYKSLAAFVTGFKTYLNCTPGELRRNTWNTNGLGR